MDLHVFIPAVFVALFGLAIGSFLNVVIHRAPIGLSIVSPRSRCAHCGVGIRPLDNIPLVSYALLGGRCRHCRARISLVYPIVELLAAVMAVALFFKYGQTWETALLFLFSCIVIVLIFIDYQHQLLPNIVTYPLFLFALAAAAVRAVWGEETTSAFGLFLIIPALETEFSAVRAALIGGALLALAAPGLRFIDWLDVILFERYFEWESTDVEPDAAAAEQEQAIERRNRRILYLVILTGFLLAAAWVVAIQGLSGRFPQMSEDAYSGLLFAAWGALLGGGTIWQLRALYFLLRRTEGMGLGDVKMMTGVGAFLGWQGAFGVLLIGSILGAVAGAYLAFRSQDGLKTALPFGVCLGVAALVILLMR
jgi:leader peptidase (prepilin peptidase)/N-methyltransferase